MSDRYELRQYDVIDVHDKNNHSYLPKIIDSKEVVKRLNALHTKVIELEAKNAGLEKPIPCGVCNNNPISNKPCICGGTGTQSGELLGLRQYIYELEEKIESAYSKDRIKIFCTHFYRWWHNQPGTNTDQGFDDWWESGHITPPEGE